MLKCRRRDSCSLAPLPLNHVRPDAQMVPGLQLDWDSDCDLFPSSLFHIAQSSPMLIATTLGTKPSFYLIKVFPTRFEAFEC